jgi:hypothetical protein
MNNSKIWLSSPHGRKRTKNTRSFDANWLRHWVPNVNGLEEDLENYLGNQSLSELLVLELPPFIWV